MFEAAGLLGESVLQTTEMDHKEGTTKPLDVKMKDEERGFQVEGITKLANDNLAMLLYNSQTSSTRIVVLD